MMSNSNEHFQFTDERFADLQMLRYRLDRKSVGRERV